jgi:hypothetical protein
VSEGPTIALDDRLAIIEDKLDFVMRTFALTSRYEHPLVPGQVVTETKNLLDIYRTAKRLHMSNEDVVRQPEDHDQPITVA